MTPVRPAARESSRTVWKMAGSAGVLEDPDPLAGAGEHDAVALARPLAVDLGERVAGISRCN